MSNCQHTPTNKKLLIGAHMPIAGGLEKALDLGTDLGCTAIQIFTKSNRQWYAKKLSPLQTELFKTTQKTSNISSITAHASYLINLCSANEEVVEKSIKSLIEELIRCDELNIPQLVLHPGSNPNKTKQAYPKQNNSEQAYPEQNYSETKTIKKIAQNINRTFEKYNGPCHIALENMAGQGSTIGSSLEELRDITAHVKKQEKIKFCFDTCHAFAAGYQFDTPETYTAMLNNLNRTLGLENLSIIHVNNSKSERGSHIDRHDHLDCGKIPLEAFNLLLNDARLATIPKILETPKGNGFECDRSNLKIMMNLINNTQL